MEMTRKVKLVAIKLLKSEVFPPLNTCDAGPGASPEGNRPFLDVLDLETKETQRLWQSSPPYLEDTGSLLCDQHDQPIK